MLLISNDRHEQKAENASFTSFLELKTSNEIEKYARNIYTHTNFYVFKRQLSLVGCTAICKVLPT